ncbi:thioesterase family protein [Nocardia lijiangensis]|uniref:thioesterase family protein n=1 Tax=Nocardia lijiangensis TaxID=299618 RepID=UPI000829D390|nr:thioesterase family protein [Nocardia lijiangensis]
MVSFFVGQGDQLVAEKLAVSPWAPDKQSGTGICGLLARELEAHCPDGFVPARLTVDLYQPVANEAFDMRSKVVRQGSRIAVVDAALVQDGQERARASAVFLTTGAEPPGQVWSPVEDLPAPPEGCVSPDGSPPLFKSGERDWTSDYAANQNAERKVSWHSLPPLVDGEPITPFQRAAILGDATNHVCHWGSEGAGYINADVTVTLSRLPVGYELGLRADNTIAAGGISIGSATLYDRTGPVGTCVVTTLSNARRQIDFTTTTTAALAGEPR